MIVSVNGVHVAVPPHPTLAQQCPTTATISNSYGLLWIASYNHDSPGPAPLANKGAYTVSGTQNNRRGFRIEETEEARLSRLFLTFLLPITA